jgi:tyrosyl-tRNA synthetase
MRLFTDIPLDEIAQFEALQGAEINTAKVKLANEATKLLHGENNSVAAELTARLVFRDHEIAEGLRVALVPFAELEEGIPAFRLFAMAGLAASNGEARRLIRGGGARVNDTPVTEEGQVISLADAREGAIKLSAGRKQHLLVRAV